MLLELTSAEPESALAAIAMEGIGLHEINQKGPLTYVFSIRRADFRTLSILCHKRGETLKILKKRGLYWKGKQLLDRPVFLVGTVLLLALVLYLPSRVLFIRVEGNVSIPDNRILEAAESSGIRFGASRRQVRSEKVKNELLSLVPQLQWAGVNTAGCVATISVRERTQPEEAAPKHAVSKIVATRDGYILSGTVTSGNPLFQVGQAVKAGEVLVSGYTDCGICIRAEASEGEIFAETQRSILALTPVQGIERREAGRETRNYSLLIGKKRINLWKGSRNLSICCGRMYMEYYVTLPGGFQLPIALCVETVTDWETEAFEKAEDEAGNALKQFAGEYLVQQMAAGKILSREEWVSLRDGLCRLEGKYVCAEMIGRVEEEQIGEHNGEDS